MVKIVSGSMRTILGDRIIFMRSYLLLRVRNYLLLIVALNRWFN